MWKDPEIRHRIIRGWNATIDENSILRYLTKDKYGHGTHCAGIIGALVNNQKGIAGIAGIAGIVKLMACKAFNGNEGTIPTKNVIQCINYAREHDAKILNCSFKVSDVVEEESISELRKAFKNAANAGIISVIAAGNDGENNDNVTLYPANFATGNDPVKNMIVVAATDQEGKLASWVLKDEQGNVPRQKSSNYGKGTVHLAAPGKDILSTGHSSSQSYVTMTGSSMAVPHVVGALAVMMAKKPFVPSREDLTETDKNKELQDYNKELIDTLCELAKKDTDPLQSGYKIQERVTYGRLDLNEALLSFTSTADSSILPIERASAGFF